MMAAAQRWEAPVAFDSDVARLRRGDPDALTPLLARYQNRLYRYLLRLVREPATAEDLFQQTWIRIAERIRQYDPRRSFEAWFFSVARNLAIDHLRRHVPESLDAPIGGDEGSATAGDFVPAAGPSVLETMLTGERAALLMDSLGELPVIYREVLTLRFEEEMKLEEIAAVLDVPLSTVKTRLRRGLEGLRGRLENRLPRREWQ